MSRNSYIGIARLAIHPEFSQRVVALVCPVCGTKHTRVREYDADFLGHNPPAELAFAKLSAHTYRREADRRGWPSAEVMLDGTDAR